MAWTIDDRMYLMGGLNGDKYVTSVNRLFFDDKENLFHDTPIKNTTIPCVFCHPFVLSDNRHVLIFRMQQDIDNFLAHTAVYKYDTQTDTIAEITPRENNTLIPAVMFTTSAMSVLKDSIYLFGGYYNEGSTGHILRLDPSTLVLTNLTALPPYPTYAHSMGCATTLNSGEIVLGFGIDPMESVSVDQVSIYSPWDNSIRTQPISGSLPVQREHTTCNLGLDQTTIYYFGGQTQKDESNALDILDTNSWAWVAKEVPGLAARPRSGSVARVIKDKLVIFGGETKSLGLNDVCVLKGLPQEAGSISSSKLFWFTNNPYYDDAIDPAVQLSAGAIAGIVLGSVAGLLLLLFLIFRRTRKFRSLLFTVRNDFIWNPRTGEPNWVEFSRLIVRCLGFGLSVGFLIYVIVRSINSATVKQEVKEHIDAIKVPNVRICLTGYETSGIRVHCEFVNGTWCDERLTLLDPEIHAPTYLHRKNEPIYCTHFGPDEHNKFVHDRHNYIDISTTGIHFTLYGNRSIPDTKGLIQVDMYESNNDPHTSLFSIPTIKPTSLSDLEIRKWDASELNSELLYRPIVVPEGEFMDILYMEKVYEILKDDGWNIMGMFSKYDKTSVIDAKLISSPSNQAGGEYLGTITIQPEAFSKYVYTEEKVFTLLYGIAQLGGIFGIFVAIETILFGFRPQSPLGMVHRFSPDDFQTRLKTKMTKHFNDDDGINSDSRLEKITDEENEADRLRRMEERIQLTEFLLKSYYIDDEVFKFAKEATEGKTQDNNKKKASPSSFMNLTSKISMDKSTSQIL